jgi:hypothetical protein
MDIVKIRYKQTAVFTKFLSCERPNSGKFQNLLFTTRPNYGKINLNSTQPREFGALFSREFGVQAVSRARRYSLWRTPHTIAAAPKGVFNRR